MANGSFRSVGCGDTGHYHSLEKDRVVRTRFFRRATPIHQNNRAILTVFFATSVVGFMVIYLEVSRLLMPDKYLTTRDLRRLTQGFANDIPWSRDRILQSHPPPFSRRKPAAIVIGFEDCGADHLVNLMALHPDVRVNKKDIRFFEGNHTEQWYISKMPLTLPHHVTVDASLNYVTNPAILQSIKEFDGQIRVIVAICDPVTRLLLRVISGYSVGKHFKFIDGDASNDNNISTNTVGKHQTFINNTFPEKSKSNFHGARNDTFANSSNLNGKDDTANRNKRSIPHPFFNEGSSKDNSSHTNNTQLVEKMTSYLKSQIFVPDENGRMTFDSKLLTQNGEFMNQMSKVFATFSQNQIHVVNMDEIYSKNTEWTHLLEFLRVKYKDLPPKTSDSESNNVMNTKNSSENFLKFISVFYDWLQRDNQQLFERLKDFHSPTPKDLSSLMNKSLS